MGPRRALTCTRCNCETGTVSAHNGHVSRKGLSSPFPAGALAPSPVAPTGLTPASSRLCRAGIRVPYPLSRGSRPGWGGRGGGQPPGHTVYTQPSPLRKEQVRTEARALGTRAAKLTLKVAGSCHQGSRHQLYASSRTALERKTPLFS